MEHVIQGVIELFKPLDGSKEDLKERATARGYLLQTFDEVTNHYLKRIYQVAN